MKARIELTRIDNRLVHGQVGLTWGSTLNIDTIVVVDNLTAASSFAQKLMQSVASAASRQIRLQYMTSSVHTMTTQVIKSCSLSYSHRMRRVCWWKRELN